MVKRSNQNFSSDLFSGTAGYLTRELDKVLPAFWNKSDESSIFDFNHKGDLPHAPAVQKIESTH